MNHELASALGEEVSAVATIVAVDQRKISFSFEAFDSKKQRIGHGVHDRFVLNEERFHAKLKK